MELARVVAYDEHVVLLNFLLLFRCCTPASDRRWRVDLLRQEKAKSEARTQPTIDVNN